MKKFIFNVLLGSLVTFGAINLYEYIKPKPDPEIERLMNKPVLKLYVVYDEVSNTKCTIYSFKSRKEVIEAIYSISTDDCYLTITEYQPARIPIKNGKTNNSVSSN